MRRKKLIKDRRSSDDLREALRQINIENLKLFSVEDRIKKNKAILDKFFDDWWDENMVKKTKIPKERIRKSPARRPD